MGATQRTRRCVLILMVAVAFGVAGCPGFNLLTTQQEVALGRQVAAQVESKSVVYGDPAWQQRIQSIGQRLVRVCDRKDVAFRFTVLQDHKQVNAFACPGGFIYVYTGLIRAARNEHELAGVLAHEIGHVVARHSAQSISSKYALEAVLKAAMGDKPSTSAQLATQLIAGAGFARMSRGAEYQADELAVVYMMRAGYDPNGMVSFLHKLNQLGKSNPNSVSALFASHPPTPERIARVQSLIASLRSGGAPRAGQAMLGGLPNPSVRYAPGPSGAVRRFHGGGGALPFWGATGAAPARPVPPAATASRRKQGRVMICRNLTKGNVVAPKVAIASTFQSRRRGLLGRASLAPDEGLHLIPCRSVHTLRMKFAIDVVFLDRKLVVTKVAPNVKPGRPWLASRKAHSTLELAAGVAVAKRIEVGDRLRFVPPAAAAEGETRP